MTTKKLIERRGYLKNLNTGALDRLRDTLRAEVTLVMDGVGERDLTLTVSRAEADALKLAVYAGLEMKLSVVLEVDEKTIRERVEKLEQEVAGLKGLVGG